MQMQGDDLQIEGIELYDHPDHPGRGGQVLLRPRWGQVEITAASHASVTEEIRRNPHVGFR